MKIRIENVGPVKTIDLDLSKPFIIFTGLNGSPKAFSVLFVTISLMLFIRSMLYL